MSLEYAVLGFLSGGPVSGYDLKTRCFDRRLSHCWTADQAQIYRILERLRKRRLISVRTVRQQGKPDRRAYSLTDAGHDELRRWLKHAARSSPLRDPFLIQVFFAFQLDDRELVTLLSEARRTSMERLQGLRREVGAESASHPISRVSHAGDGMARSRRAAALRLMTLKAAMAQARAMVDWLDDCIEAASEGLPGGDST